MTDELSPSPAATPSPPFRRHRRRLALVTVILLAVLWTAGFLQFARDVPKRPGDVSTPTDAIVVLTGGSERLGTGFQLLRQRLGRKLFISGVHRGVEIPDLLRQAPQPDNDLASCVVLGHAAADTVGNAIETAAWMHAQGYTSLRLVTANYHMQRSLLEFSWAMPDIRIVPHPVFPFTVKRTEWWRWPGTAQLIASEYNKYLAARVRHWLETIEETP